MVGPLLVADWAPHPDEGDKLLLVFDGGTLTVEQIGAIRLQADELASFAFHDPAETTALLIPRLARRVAVAVDARQAGCPVYLEHGVPPIHQHEQHKPIWNVASLGVGVRNVTAGDGE